MEEENWIKYEAALNRAMDDYFNARQGLSRTKIQEQVFEGGFRMAWSDSSQLAPPKDK